jgi:hypothetical protein
MLLVYPCKKTVPPPRRPVVCCATEKARRAPRGSSPRARRPDQPTAAGLSLLSSGPERSGLVPRRKTLYVIDPDDDPYLKRKREMEERARDSPREAAPGEETRPPRGPVADPDPPTRPDVAPPDSGPVRRTDGFLLVTNHLLDDILPTLDPPEQAVLLRLYRLTHGFNRTTCRVSRAKLTAKTRVKKTRLQEALAALEGRGLIRRHADDTGNCDLALRGMLVEVLVGPVRVADPSGARTRPPAGHNKEELKDNSIKGARARDYSECPDCLGSGMWYPEGFGKGVKRCTHPRLQAT